MLHTGDLNRSKLGAFQAAYELKLSVRVFGSDRAALEELLEWFRANLAEPGRFTRTKSKGQYRAKKGLSWFKPGAVEAIQKMREMTEILGRHGYSVEELRTLRPGLVTYENDLQVIAEPFAETPT